MHFAGQRSILHNRPSLLRNERPRNRSISSTPTHRLISRRPLSVKQHHQTYGLIVVPTVDRCNCDNRCRDCCIFNCSALVSACTFICFALSFAAFAFAFNLLTRCSAAPFCLISSSVIPAPAFTCCIYRGLSVCVGLSARNLTDFEFKLDSTRTLLRMFQKTNS